MSELTYHDLGVEDLLGNMVHVCDDCGCHFVGDKCPAGKHLPDHRWLVDEFLLDVDGVERVRWHAIVTAKHFQEAFTEAEQLSLKTRTWQSEPCGFFFAPEELELIDEDYRWAASDGSSVCYEVRKLD
jgi:hypothetical protein